MQFTQTNHWAEFQKQLGRQTFHKSGESWEYLAILERGTGNTRLYCPYGPHADNQESFELAIESLVALAKQYRVTFIRIEPTDTSLLPYLKANKWRKVTYQSLNPEHTQVIDLTQPQDTIIAEMVQNTRNIYRNYQKKGVSIKKSQNPSDISIFLELIHKVATRTGMRPHSDDYFKAQADILFPSGAANLWYATYQNCPIAAALLYDSPDTRHYAHAAAEDSPEVRKLNAGTALVAEAIIDARNQGLTSFDLYGIAPDGANKDHPWYGFTRFKKSFGGQEVSFCGSWDLPLNTLAYQIYKTYQTLRK